MGKIILQVDAGEKLIQYSDTNSVNLLFNNCTANKKSEENLFRVNKV